ncbi:Hsp70 family protein [Chloroflexi bacterium TSY]|nr:Hsp70 family protein [Chloroflexi bacterium TSY]
MRIGVDFGTTNTSAAIYDGKNLRFIPLDASDQSPHILRSMVYIDRDHKHRLGIDAVKTFLAEDTGRPAIYEEKYVGTIEATFSSGKDPISVIWDAVVDEDVGRRGRLLQSVKTGLQTSWYEGTKIFGRYYRIQELIALLLTHVRCCAESTLQTDVDKVVLGRPVKFSDNPTEDQVAEERLQEAAALAGFKQTTFVREPIAAAHFYLSEIDKPESCLIFDFGGGTLDLTIIKNHLSQQTPQNENAYDYEVLATRGVLIGGDDLDSALMKSVIAPFFGTTTKIDTSYNGRPLFMPESMSRLLYRWQTIPMLSRDESLETIERAIQYGDDPQTFQALNCLATQNYGFALFEKIEQAKRQLSKQRQTKLAMQAQSIDLDIEITRKVFNHAILDEIAEIRRAVREVIQSAGIAKETIATVVSTGGSSNIPMMQSMLKRELPSAQFVQSDIFGSVTSGLAMMAARSSE